MRPVRTFKVRPALPEPLARLRNIAYNLRWAWDHESIELFRRLDSDLWEATGHNPVRMLGFIDQARLNSAASDDALLAHLDRVARDLDEYLASKTTWYDRSYRGLNGLQAAYFSAEFGVTESLSIFAGGLGILAGDHLKAASDMGVPLIGIGLLYQQGYFRQYLNAAGWQQEAYEDNDFHNLAVSPVPGVSVTLDLPGRRVVAQVWLAQVGRVALYLLDTNVGENAPADRDITDQLYGGDLDMRLRQEIVLGIGGYRALRALGITPNVLHMNEGHSAFLAIEHIRHLVGARGLSFAEAREAASASLVFTTHTPVAAGHDYFPPGLMQHYFSDYARGLGVEWRQFMALGRSNPADESESFCMTVLALRTAAASNAVSKLHGAVTRRMWNGIWPGLPEPEVPVSHVTNGVHFRSWVSSEMNHLYDRYLGPKWREEPADPTLWKRIESIPAEELWRTHERRRERLVAYSRRKLRVQLIERGAPQWEVDAADEVLDPEALTIGFARRFASYKRATLLLRNPDRLRSLLTNTAQPVQILYAGKAHPRDDAGKELIRTIVSLAAQSELRPRIVFLEDYDLSVARYLLQGCDIWLNTPRRPLEASGTSGMKALANGVLNVSTLDGWWDEAWRDAAGRGEQPGWAIGRGEDYVDTNLQDQLEGDALYELLEREVVPAFYDRGRDGIPRRWVDRMKLSLRTLCPEFTMHRQVKEYTERFYMPGHARYEAMIADGAARARRQAAWLEGIRRNWPSVRVQSVAGPEENLAVGAPLTATAEIRLPGLSPEDVHVEFMVGRVDKTGELIEPVAYAMKAAGQNGDVWTYTCSAPCCPASGLHGYTARVLPSHPELLVDFVPGLITWADGVAAGAAG